MRPAVFLDRDGTLIREAHYLSRMEDLEVLPGVPEGLGRLRRAGFALVGVTNQSGVARGYFDLSFVEAVHREIDRRLGPAAALDGWYVCPHHPEFTGPCGCRKPEPGLVLRAAAELGLDPGRSWVVGDKPADLELARRTGCRAVLVRTGYGRETEERLGASGVKPDAIADDLRAAADRILGSSVREAERKR